MSILKVTVIQDDVESEFTSSKEKVIIGRGTSTDIKVVSNAVSREHLEVLIKDGQIFVKDITAGNWVSYNDEKLSKEDYTEYYDFINMQLPDKISIKLSLMTEEEANALKAKSEPKAVKAGSSTVRKKRSGNTKTTIKKINTKKNTKKKTKSTKKGSDKKEHSPFVKYGSIVMLILALVYAYMIRDQIF